MAIKQRSKNRKAQARLALASVGSQVWHMDPRAFGDMLQAVQTMAESGAVDSEASGPMAGVSLPSAEYSSRVARAGRSVVIPITGMIEPETSFYTKYFGGTSCAQVRSDLRNADADTTIDEIHLLFDTPGGIAMGVQETADLIAQIATRKKVTAYCRNLCASAGYYLASSASQIVATPSTAVGSVGSIIGHMSYEKMLAEMGITYTAITFGANKGEGSSYKDLDPNSRQGITDFVRAYGEQFANHVATQRGVTFSEVMERFGQGRVYIAAEALSRGMIDSIGLIENVIGNATQASPQPQYDSTTPKPTNQQTTTTANENAAVISQESPHVKRLIALLFANGLISTLEPGEGVVQACMNAFCSARGVDVPVSADGKLDEVACMAIINGKAPANTANQTKTTPAEQPATNAATDLGAYKARQKEIRSTAQLLNGGRSTPVVSHAEIEAAVESNLTLEEVRQKWNDKLEAQPENKNTIGTNIDFGSTGEDRFVQTATDALLARMGHKPSSAVPSDMRSISLFDIGARCAQYAGLRLSGNREDMALDMLQQSPGTIVMNTTSFNRAGDFPNLLSNLANKILDEAFVLAEPTFPQWTQRLVDVSDFKPQTIIGTGVFDNMDLIQDDDEAQQLKMADEMKGWFQADRYANKVGMTPVMMANDDLDGFNQQLMSLAMAHDLTLNTLCLNLIAGNPTLVDGIALFNASHGNLVSGGGVPSEAQAKKNRLLHRAQTATGSTRTLNSRPRVVLVPYTLEDDALKTYMSIAELAQIAGGESKVATTDATINVHRGTVRVVVEPGLDAYSGGTAAWYTFDDRIRTIVHGYQTGYGSGGRRTTWFEPSRGTRYIQLEGRFGAAAVGYRGAVKNPGS